MKKWITSNYHYMVPELDYTGKPKSCIRPDLTSFLEEVRRGMNYLGAETATPVVIGPVTMIHLAQIKMLGEYDCFSPGFETEQRRKILIEILVPSYKKLISDLAGMGCTEVQIHEAALVMEDDSLLGLFGTAYPEVLLEKGNMKVNMVASFMEDVGVNHYKWLISVADFDIVSLDFTRGDTLDHIDALGFPESKILGAGLVDCRSVWRVDPEKLRPMLSKIKAVRNIRVQPSGSLQYNPWTLECETAILQHSAGNVLSFAKEKLEELTMVTESFTDPTVFDKVSEHWSLYRSKVVTSQSSFSVTNQLKALQESDFVRAEPFNIRRPKQLKNSPLLPTTTIGSFPQTKEVRQLRAKLKKGTMTQAEYERAIDQQIAFCIGIQAALGLDIFVHGEPERTDMVEFFAQKMEGMLFTTNGWVQSFGSRCVRPPIIWADIVRSQPMTTREFRVAQDLTEKPVKGMLTGPVTILNWSFPRADISRKEQAYQLALAIRGEISDLEAAGCCVVQVDEPALREAMPLKASKKQEYLDWAVDAFRLATAKAASETQIHTHMCYCEFAGKLCSLWNVLQN